jgi:hypothetical protein
MSEEFNFKTVKQGTMKWMEEEGWEDSIDEGIRKVIRALNSHPDICTQESCAGSFELLASPVDVFKTGRNPLAENNPETGLPRFHECCPLCSQGAVCDLQKLAAHRVKFPKMDGASYIHDGTSYITKPMLPELRFDWIPEYREEWSHGLKRFGSQLTTEDIEDVLGGLDVPDGFMILLELNSPYVVAMGRDPEVEWKFLKAVHSAGWLYSFQTYWARGSYGPTGKTVPCDWSIVSVSESITLSVHIPLGNPKESLPPPERLELIVREANVAMERWQAKLPALEQVPSSL